MSDLILLKLGGSLITDKHTPSTIRGDMLARLAGEIASVWQETRSRLILGHGSGSFGHVPAAKYGTRAGVHSPADWQGFVAVWREARALNQLVLDALIKAGLPAMSFPPSASVVARDGQVDSWDLAPIQAALDAGLLPVVQGDTIFDRQRGGTILSTEDLFVSLAGRLHPRVILLAGQEAGVWADFPNCTQLVSTLNPAGYAQIAAGLAGSAATDVTGGMLAKVRAMLALVEEDPGLQAVIFSGAQPGAVARALRGQFSGTIIRS